MVVETGIQEVGSSEGNDLSVARVNFGGAWICGKIPVATCDAARTDFIGKVDSFKDCIKNKEEKKGKNIPIPITTSLDAVIKETKG